MYVGYVRSVRNKDEHRYQSRMIHRLKCDKYIVEKELNQFDYENSDLKKIIDEMEPGDKLIIATIRALGFSTRQLLPFFNMLEERKIDIRIQDLGVDTSKEKYNFVFDLVRYFQESDRILDNERRKVVNKRSDLNAGAPSIEQEKIDEIFKLRSEGKLLKEIAEIADVSYVTAQKYSRIYAIENGLPLRKKRKRKKKTNKKTEQ